jgi:hypothetical protein
LILHSIIAYIQYFCINEAVFDEMESVDFDLGELPFDDRDREICKLALSILWRGV